MVTGKDSGHSTEPVKVVYIKEGDPHRTEFFVFADPEQLQTWRYNRSIPLVLVLESFEIFTGDTRGHTGQAMRASQQILHSVFGTTDTTFIFDKILEEGTVISLHNSRAMKEHGAKITRDHSVEVHSA